MKKNLILKHQPTKLKFIILSLGILLNLGITFGQDTTSFVQNEVSPDTSLTTDTISVPTEKSSISSIINYDAVDSILFDVAKQEATLYGRAHLDYGEIQVDAPEIIVDLKNSTLKAKSSFDSTGKITEYAMLKQKDDESQAEVIIFNYKTKRGYIENVYMQEGEGYIHSNEAYLDEEKNLYVQGASYTTCNLQHPHYHFHMQKAKIIPDDKVIASMVNLYIDSIPTPLGLPFGLFPTKDAKTSGVILPNDFGEQSLGFYLRGFGYYWAINDTISMKFTGEVYSKGTYGLTATTNYKIRYRYSGSLVTNYRNVINAGDEYNAQSKKTYKITWRHSPEGRNGRKLTADVNYQDGSYNNFNYSESEALTIPQINSSINLSLPLNGLPFSATVSLKHSQSPTTIDGLKQAVNTFYLPNFNIGYTGESNPYKNLPYTNITPSKFRKKVLEQFKITYSTSGKNFMSTKALALPTAPAENYSIKYDENLGNAQYGIDTTDLVMSSKTIKDLLKRNKFYMVHTTSIQNNLKIKSFTFTPSFNYSENWYFKQTGYEINQADSSLILSQNSGFYRIGRYNASARLNTTFYNFYSLGRVKTKTINGEEKTIDRKLKFRQTIQPSVAYTVSPNYNTDEEIYQYLTLSGDSTAQTIAYDKFLLYQGRPSTSGKQQSLSFSLNNTFEMKMPGKWSDTKDTKPRDPIKILQLNGSFNYNLAADSLKMSNIAITAANSNLLNGLANFRASASFDPYQFDSVGTSYSRVNKYWAEDNGFLARLSLISITSGISLSPKVFQKKNKTDDPDKEEKAPEVNQSNYLDFSMPWTLRLSHTYTWSLANPMADTSKLNTLSTSGTLKLSENWSSILSVNYNVQTKEFTYPKIGLTRDLHCWQMRFEWVPFGPAATRRYSFFIGVKADMLKDLKYKKQNNPYDRSSF